MKEYNIGFIGCGNIFKTHYESVGLLEGLNISWICDLKHDDESYLTENKITKLTERHVDEVDIIVVLTDSGSHIDIIKSLPCYPKLILIEKPIVLKVEDFKILKEIESNNDTKFFEVKQNRYNPSTESLLQDINNKKLFGDLISGHLSVHWCRDDNYYNAHAWRGSWLKDGGVLTNQSIHHLDILRLVCGQFNKISAKYWSVKDYIEAEDVLKASVTFGNGAEVSIDVTTLARPKNRHATLNLIFEKGYMELGGFAFEKFFSYSDVTKTYISAVEESLPYKTVKQKGHYKLYQNIINYLQGNDYNLVDLNDSKSTLNLLHSIYYACESNETVLENQTSSKLGLLPPSS